jgi:hypothetical protein
MRTTNLIIPLSDYQGIDSVLQYFFQQMEMWENQEIRRTLRNNEERVPGPFYFLYCPRLLDFKYYVFIGLESGRTNRLFAERYVATRREVNDNLPMIQDYPTQVFVL